MCESVQTDAVRGTKENVALHSLPNSWAIDNYGDAVFSELGSGTDSGDHEELG